MFKNIALLLTVLSTGGLANAALRPSRNSSLNHNQTLSAMPVVRPSLPATFDTEATPTSAVDHVACEVRSCVVPSVYVPVAVSCTVVPLAIDLADDRIVADVLANRVLEGFGHALCQPLRRTQFRAAGAVILVNFCFSRDNRFAMYWIEGAYQISEEIFLHFIFYVAAAQIIFDHLVFQ